MAEHKYEYFLSLVEKDNQPLFLYENDFGFLAHISKTGKKTVITSIDEPLTKQDNIIPALKKLIEYCLETKKLDKIILETREETNKKLKLALKDSKYRVLKSRYYLTWPVFILKNFDENLSGTKNKKLRNFRNNFFRDNQNIEITNFKESDKEGLKTLVLEWKKKRTAHDILEYYKYIEFIESNFKGFDMVKIIKINNKPVSVFGGWKIPNSKNYYSCIGIYDYDIDNLAEVSNILDLIEIKKLGMEKADFGGSEQALLNFKMKFHPAEFYRTDIFAVEKKNLNSSQNF